MKAQRLLAITMLLLNRESASAAELARRFEVSRRTIYRDVEALCEAGIPVVATQGAGGGYGIMGEFRIDRGLLKPEEIGTLSATLSSISRAIGDAGMGQTVDRLKALAPRGKVAGRPVPENYLFIELEPAARDRAKIALLRRAIEERRVARFRYTGAEGKRSERAVEPCAIVFIWQAWYLYAYCRARSAFRLFKIARVADLALEAERFPPREVDLDSRPWNAEWGEPAAFLPARIRFADAVRAQEHFHPDQVELEASGSALVTAPLPADDWAVSYLLGLGLPFEVLEPAALRSLVAERAAGVLARHAT
jgi:predicted DNA-binding transcriptional regulator YafY